MIKVEIIDTAISPSDQMKDNMKLNNTFWLSMARKNENGTKLNEFLKRYNLKKSVLLESFVSQVKHLD